MEVKLHPEGFGFVWDLKVLRRDFCGDVNFSDDRFMAFLFGPFTFVKCTRSL